jgi:4-cresol dehydrogenase (hydroxylating)
MMAIEGLQSAINQWQVILGDSRVVIGAAAGQLYGPNTIATAKKIPAALLINSQSEVISCVNVARECRVPIYPVSTGKNWGYGSSNPVSDGCVIMDLSAMNRVLDFDPLSGVVTVEPGVTQGQLRDYLDAGGHEFLVPVTGAGPSCSLLGNALERGYGITPIADHFLALTSLRAVLADGSLYQSPLSTLGGVQVDRAFKWGIGPYLDGLFSQGSFGVVTEVSLILARRPVAVEAFFFAAKNDADLEQLVSCVQQCNAELGANLGSINLLNNRRMLSMVESYPETSVAEGDILSDDQVDSLSRKNGISPWTGTGALYGHPKIIKAAKALLKKKLKPHVARFIFVNDRRIALLVGLLKFTPQGARVRLQVVIRTLRNTLDILKGIPNEMALPLAYWRSGGPERVVGELNPARDNCGLIWYAPLVPMTSDQVRKFVIIVGDICPRYGIEPLITLTSLSDRCFDCTIPLLYDGENELRGTQAKACYAALVDAGMKEGFVPYRLNVDAMASMGVNLGNNWQLISDIKSVLDPLGLIAPGRYSPLDADKTLEP